MVQSLLALQDALDGSMRYDYGGPEPLNALANLRLSQSKPEEAAKSAEEAFRRLGLCGGYTYFTLKTGSGVRCGGVGLHFISGVRIPPMRRLCRRCAESWIPLAQFGNIHTRLEPPASSADTSTSFPPEPFATRASTRPRISCVPGEGPCGVLFCQRLVPGEGRCTYTRFDDFRMLDPLDGRNSSLSLFEIWNLVYWSIPVHCASRKDIRSTA